MVTWTEVVTVEDRRSLLPDVRDQRKASVLGLSELEEPSDLLCQEWKGLGSGV